MNIVYKFVSKVSGKYYIGSKVECRVVGNNIVDRKGKYYYTSSLSSELAKEFAEGNMMLEILEDKIPREILLKREDYWQHLYSAVEDPNCYNRGYALFFNTERKQKLKNQDDIGNIFGETLKEITTNNRVIGRRDSRAQKLGYENFGILYKWILEKREEGLSFKSIDRVLNADHFAGRTVSVHHGHNPAFVTTLEDFDRKDIDLLKVKLQLLQGKTLLRICKDEDYPVVVVRYLLGGKDFKNLIELEDKIAIHSGFLNRKDLEYYVMREYLKDNSYTNIANSLEGLSNSTCQRIVHKLVKERLNISDFELT